MSLLSTYDLRLWMGIEEGDKKPNAKLATIALAVEDFVNTYTNRQLEAKRYKTDPQWCYLDGVGLPYIYLPQYPVSWIGDISIDGDREFGSGTVIASADLYFYPSGKLCSEAGYFTRGRRNVNVDFIAGYAPVVGGTHNNAVSTYPLPRDLHQVMNEMAVESFKEGITAIHTVQGGQNESGKIVRLLSGKSFWRVTLNKYTSHSSVMRGRAE